MKPKIGIYQPPEAGIPVEGKDAGILVETIVKNIVALFFTISAIAFVVMILWGATEWILSGGDKEKVASARRRIVMAIVGITILGLAFVIIDIVGQIVGIDFGGPLNIPNIKRGA